MISIANFKKKIWGYYRANRRDFAWRRTRNPYRILISEIMLQQTQVSRVEGFYEKFIKNFPDFRTLAKAETADILRAWQGLGYNRRALALRNLSKIIVHGYGGHLPHDRATLESLPGIGPYTAGAICTFAWNEPEIFIETNIRRVFIRFFFPRAKKVSDKKIFDYIERSFDIIKPREWYYALMDYGAMLGAQAGVKNPNRRSAHYARQSRFSGSDRELRGKVLRLVLARKKIKRDEIHEIISGSKPRIRKITAALVREGFVKERNNSLQCV
jgi:A/G-specific adenine glycosylase